MIDLRDAIAARIRELLARPPETWRWMVPAVERHHFLPLYVDWSAVLGIRPDGSFTVWHTDGEGLQVTTLVSPYWCRLAIAQGAKRYPELAPLVPSRVDGAATCATCQGDGELARADLVCECGGAGWFVPGEDRGAPVG